MDSKGNVYIMDPIYGQLLRYNRLGQYLDDKMPLIGGAGLLVNRDDAIFILEKKYGEFMQVRKISFLDRAVEDSIPFFSKKERLVTCYLRDSAQLCYNLTRDRLYYLEANDYMVKEINASTGKIMRQFGTLVPAYNPFTLEKRSPDFKFLPSKYHNLSCGSIDIHSFFNTVLNEINQATSALLKSRH